MELVEPPSPDPAGDADPVRTPSSTGLQPPTTAPRPSPDPNRLPISGPVVAALVLLVLCASVSAGFVIQRGGIALPTAVAIASAGPSATPAPTESPVPSVEPATPTPPLPPPTATPTEGPSPSIAPSPVPSPSIGSRVVLLTPCTDAPDCYIYVVRHNDKLIAIAAYFGVPLATIYEMNPRYAHGSVLQTGDRLRLPPPTR